MPTASATTLTSHDFLKTAAIVLMIIDHIGAYFFPDQMWWRAVGRLSAPVWLFLIGFANSREISLRWACGLFILMFVDYAVGRQIFPISILATMILARAVLDPVMGYLRRDTDMLYPFAFILFLLSFITVWIFEYGTLGMMVVMAGYLCRHGREMNFTQEKLTVYLLITAGAYYCINAEILFVKFDALQKIFVGAGAAIVMLGLGRFRSAESHEWAAKMPGPVAWLLRVCGRYSLEIYVLHLALFALIGLYAGLPGYRFFEFKTF